VSAGDGGGEPVDRAVLAEINEEVRRRRETGELLPSFERGLDDAFAAEAPDRGKGAFRAVLEVAERSSHVDVEVPVRSNLPGGQLAKGTLRKLMWWYLDYVADQLTRFGSATTRLLRMLDDRLSQLEDVGAAADAAGRLAPPFDPSPWFDAVRTATAGAPGPVLHASCADGALLKALAAGDVAAYGVDARDDLLDRAAAAGLDVRLEHPLRHLRGLTDGALGGAVLSGFVDLLALPGHARVVEQVRAKLRPGGVLVVLGTSPEAWGHAVPVAVADLSPGRPLHAETWQHLLVEGGFEKAEVHLGQGPDGPATFAVVGVRAS
jgi:SAM-dependent methyltransferase